MAIQQMDVFGSQLQSKEGKQTILILVGIQPDKYNIISLLTEHERKQLKQTTWIYIPTLKSECPKSF